MTIQSAALAPLPAARLTRAQRRTILLASLGGGLDYFDFVIYAVFARYIAASFFPMVTPLVSVMLALMVYALGMFARPLGGMLLSHYGDKYGRRGSFMLSLAVMSSASICVGLMPTYQTWGITASLLLIALRLLQGMAIGGEVPNALTYVVETVPRRASFATGIVQTFVTFGILLATSLNAVVQSQLSPAHVASFGWRIPFLVGGVLGFIGLYFRRALEESPDFANMREAAAKAPVTEMLREHWKPLLVGVLITLIVASFNGMLFAYMPVYLSSILKYEPAEVAQAQTLAMLIYTASILGFSWVGDHVPRYWLLRTGGILIGGFAVPFYSALASHSIGLYTLLALAAAVGGVSSSVWACILADLFPTRVRFSGSALSSNIGIGFFSGLAPLSATWLISTTHLLIAPAFYLSGSCAVALVASIWLPRYLGHIRRSQPA